MGYVDYYLTTMKIAIQQQLQYRVANYMYMLGMITEPVIYLVVWSTVARESGGSVAGFTAGSFAAYYIVWTLVRNINIVFTPYGWEQRIRQGSFSQELLKPIHPLHYDIAYFAGWKVVVVLLWIPLAVALSLLFHPVFHLTVLGVITFFLALWGAYLIRTFNQWMLGLITFWTTRVGAIFQLYIGFELILSGRLVPLALMPRWVQTIAAFLPFQWTFQFPIEALIGRLGPQALLSGLLMQALWILIGIGGVRYAFRAAVRHYSAVGN